MANKKKTSKTFFDYHPDFPRDKSHLIQLCLPREKMNNKKTPQFPLMYSEKLDGVFCFAVCDTTSVHIFSRTGEEYLSLEHLKPELYDISTTLCTDVIIFEGYAKGVPQPTISGWCRDTKNQHYEVGAYVHDALSLDEFFGACEIRTYEDSGIKIRVLRFQIDPNVVDKSLAKKQIFAFLNKYGDLEAPTQYATVWNNGLPGFLVDRYKSNGESYLRHFTKDSEYYYSYRIDYDESKSSYKHKQLRDMVEYVDFDNVESLRKAPQWRISNSHKKKLDADPIFNPWYMEWIKILTQ